MAISLETFRAQVDTLLTADDAELPALSRRRLIRAAIDRYSIDRPDTASADVTGTGSSYYPLTGLGAVLSAWQDGFSVITGIEYPAAVIASNEPPNLLEMGDWDDGYEAGGVRYLRLLSAAPAATETFRVRYTAPLSWAAATAATAYTQIAHGLTVGDYCYQEGAVNWVKAADASIATHQVKTAADANSFTASILETNLPARDFYAVCYLAASLCCQAIATKYSRTSDSTIQADSVQHVSRAGEFSRRSKEFMTAYAAALGKAGSDSGPTAAAQFADLDAAPGWPLGRDFLFHGRGHR